VRRIILGALIIGAVTLLAAPASATHTVEVATNQRAVLVSPKQVLVSGTVDCSGKPLDARPRLEVSVTLDNPPRGFDAEPIGSGYTEFFHCRNEVVGWAVLVHVREKPRNWLDFDTFVRTPCSDDEFDCPSDDEIGVLQVKR